MKATLHFPKDHPTPLKLGEMGVSSGVSNRVMIQRYTGFSVSFKYENLGKCNESGDLLSDRETVISFRWRDCLRILANSFLVTECWDVTVPKGTCPACSSTLFPGINAFTVKCYTS